MILILLLITVKKSLISKDAGSHRKEVIEVRKNKLRNKKYMISTIKVNHNIYNFQPPASLF